MTQRPNNELRPVSIQVNFTDAPLASVLICTGATRVMCTASLEERVPSFRLDSGGGWLTAEYSMLPGATPHRSRRAISRGKLDGRSTEIQRLIGRSLRAGFDLDQLGQRTLTIDCDVLQADGGTRTAAITGGYVAARIAVERLIHDGLAQRTALLTPIAAISVGIVNGQPVLDLDYPLDSRADVDMNVIKAGGHGYVEIQGTGERGVFDREQLDQLLALANAGIAVLREHQDAAITRALAQRPGS